jgi:hypothetical protein
MSPIFLDWIPYCTWQMWCVGHRTASDVIGRMTASGYSPDAVTLHAANRPSTILMDGADLMAALEERMEFVSLLVRKKRHAAQSGSIYLRIHQIW